MTPILAVNNIGVSYGVVPAVHDVSFEVSPGEFSVILGANGAGKTSILKAILGMLRLTAGDVWFDGRCITGLPTDQLCRLGMSWIPEGRQLWGNLTVLDNLRLG